jgi:hypothetical protein
MLHDNRYEIETMTKTELGRFIKRKLIANIGNGFSVKTSKYSVNVRWTSRTNDGAWESLDRVEKLLGHKNHEKLGETTINFYNAVLRGEV